MSNIEQFFSYLSIFDQFFWSYIGFALVCGAGLYFTVVSKGAQFRILKNFSKYFKDILAEAAASDTGVHPLKLYFASTGGMIGLGNVVGISMAVILGGPGSVLWMWVASICGMLIKYAEIYLGTKYRIINANGQYSGGSLYYLQMAFSTKTVSYLAAILLCIYGAEIYQFTVLVDRIAHNMSFSRSAITVCLLLLVLYSSLGGIKRLSNICAWMMPIFIVGYLSLGLYILFCNYQAIPGILREIFTHAFTAKAALGGFAGSSMLYAAYMGISKTVYSGDIGIGYDSIVQSETKVSNPQKQACISIYALFTDTIICTTTAMIVLVTNSIYRTDISLPSDLIADIINQYLRWGDFFTTLMLFIAGFTTVIAYLTVGFKAAVFLLPRYGKPLYLFYSIGIFLFCSQYSQQKVMLIMSVASGLLVLINLAGIFKLRHKIKW